MRIGRRLVKRGSKLGFFCIAAFVLLPFLVQMLHGPLPYVHYSSEKLRFLVALVIGVTVGIHVVATREKPAVFREGPLEGDPLGDPVGSLKTGIMILFGSLLFMWGSALLSHNVFGMISHLLPARPYLEKVAVEGAWMDGTRRNKERWQKLSMRTVDGAPRYLEITRELTGGYWYQSGDTLRLSGWQTLLGPYMTHIESVQPTGAED